jgi:uncharacterized protein
MLGPDLIRVRRRGDALKLDPLRGADRERATEIAHEILAVLRDSEGATEEEVRQLLAGISHDSKEDKVFAGLTKVALDASDFGASVEVDPIEVRRAVFAKASQVRERLSDQEPLPRPEILSEVAIELELPVETLEAALFADLKGAAELRRGPSWDADTLLEKYDMAALQGIFLASTELKIELSKPDPAALRGLFRELKFRQLLFSVELGPTGGHQITVSGPLSVFGPRTRYGLRLAQVIPSLVRNGGVRLVAQLVWGREKRSLRFEWSEATLPAEAALGDGALPELLCQVAETPAWALGGWSLEPAQSLFPVPGLGICIPDAVCRKAGYRDVHLELLGFWSREAVFRRVDLVARLPEERFVFLVPARLRVSEEVIPEGLHSSLHVFKTTVLVRRLVEQLDALGSRG